MLRNGLLRKATKNNKGDLRYKGHAIIRVVLSKGNLVKIT